MFSIVIPCFSNHIYKVFNIIQCFLLEDSIYINKKYINKKYINKKNINKKNINKKNINNKLINEIIVVCNGINSKHKLEINEKKNFFNLNNEKRIKYIEIDNKLHPGIARNKGIKQSNSEYIIFHDADDIPHPNKLEILKYIFDNNNVEHILYFLQPLGFKFINYNFENIKIISSEKIYKYYNKNKDINIGNIINKRVCQGHISIKKKASINLNWSNKKTAEDKDFNIQSLKKGNKIIMIDVILAEYNKYHVKMMKRYHKKAYDEINNFSSYNILFCLFLDEINMDNINKLTKFILSNIYIYNKDYQKEPYKIKIKIFTDTDLKLDKTNIIIQKIDKFVLKNKLKMYEIILMELKKYNKILYFKNIEDLLNFKKYKFIINYNHNISSFKLELKNLLFNKLLSYYGEFILINN